MEICDKPKKNSKRKFSEAWLSDDRYKHWIRQVLSDEFSFYCNICNKNFSCSSHISRHADSACHKNKEKEIKSCNNENIHTCNTSSKKTFRQQWLDIEDSNYGYAKSQITLSRLNVIFAIRHYLAVCQRYISTQNPTCIKVNAKKAIYKRTN